MKRNFWKPLTGLVAAFSVSVLNVSVAQAGDTYYVTNNAKVPILYMEKAFENASGPVEDWQWQKIPGSDIEPGETKEGPIINAGSGTGCKHEMRAIYEDGPSEPVKVDFCQDDPHLEFSR